MPILFHVQKIVEGLMEGKMEIIKKDQNGNGGRARHQAWTGPRGIDAYHLGRNITHVRWITRGQNCDWKKSWERFRDVFQKVTIFSFACSSLPTYHHWFKIYIAEGKEFNILHNAWLGKSPLLWISFRTQLNTWLDWWLSCHVGTSLGKSSWCLEEEYAKNKGCLMSSLLEAFESKTTQDNFYSNFILEHFAFLSACVRNMWEVTSRAFLCLAAVLVVRPK